MPNWCWITWKLTGTKRNIKNFCEHLIFEEEANKEGLKKKYFARTFADTSRSDFMENIDSEFVKIDSEFVKHNFVFDCDCAWSATSCMIDGYPQDKPINKHLITLSDACKLHKVKAELNTEEPGFGFREHIICEADGTISTDECLDYDGGDEKDG